jgi:methylglyoxal synthase
VPYQRGKLSQTGQASVMNRIKSIALVALITEGRVDILIFFWDPMQPHPHDVDVKALLRIAVVYNIPIACNRSSADFIISSHLVEEVYAPVLKDYSAYLDRQIE